MWAHPSASRKDLASILKLSAGNVRVAVHALRQRDLSRTCPECMAEKLLGGACQNCGFEPDAPVLPLEVMADSQSPTNRLHAGNLLGSVTDYSSLHFTNSGLVMKRRAEGNLEEPLIVGIKSDVENELKRYYPEEAISDEAGRLVIKEVAELAARYPKLRTAKYARAQIVENVMARLRLLHPQLRSVRTLEVDGHE